MRYIWIILSFIFMTALLGRASAAPMSDFINAEMAIAKAPGLSYSILQDGQIMSYSYGEVLKGSRLPVTDETLFPIGSISKSFTALAIMKLVEAGDIDLSANISQYLDVFKDKPSGKITVRHLLSHTSGYSTKQGNNTQISDRQSADALQRHVKQIAAWVPPHAPDTKWQYSNANYLILGALIESVSGQSFARYIETEILKPIGMEHSFVANGEVLDNMAIGHHPWFGFKHPRKNNNTDRLTAPAGGIISTASDLALYLALMINETDDIIRAETKALMMQPAGPTAPFYGLGWYIDAPNETVYHSGLTPGVETLAVLSQKQKKAVVVLINSNSGMGYGSNAKLLYGISAKALGLDFTPTQTNWGVRSIFLMFFCLPVFFLVATLLAWFRPDRLQAKSGLSGAFSLWFPLPIILVLAGVCIHLIPTLFGTSIRSLFPYQPDFSILLIATAVTGLAWVIVRLSLAYFPNVKSRSS